MSGFIMQRLKNCPTHTKTDTAKRKSRPHHSQASSLYANPSMKYAELSTEPYGKIQIPAFSAPLPHED